jgi:very-short-patch-repair endonuclease
MRQIHNRKEVEEFRRELRKSLTPAEAKLWTYLQRNQLGRKFRRQHSVDNYILDFYCATERLAIELDGEGHFTDQGKQYDVLRCEYLHQYSIRVIRFENYRVFEDIDNVIAEIKSNFT